MGLCELSADAFTQALSSKAPVPGGGGASALAGALGVSLGSMVGALTRGKKKYAAVEEDIIALMQTAEELRVKLLACVDKDAEAFEPLSAVYSMPKDAPGRDELMEKCLREAASVPLEIMRLSAEATELLAQFAAKGSVLAISDAATGASMCRAALQGAAVNVRVNTGLMKDREYAAVLDAEVDSLLGRYAPAADEIFNSVMARLSK